MARIETAYATLAWTTLGKHASPVDPGALSFGLAGIVAVAAGFLWQLATSAARS